MGRPKKQIPKRISGTGYTESEARVLKYKKKATDGSYEIDTETIKDKVNAYIDEEARTKRDNDGHAWGIKPISRPGLRSALKIYNQETYNLWLDGYVNRDHKDNEGYAANIALSEALRAGDTAIAQWLCEDEDSKHSSRTIRLLETMGEIAPAQTKHEISASISLGKWSKMGK